MWFSLLFTLFTFSQALISDSGDFFYKLNVADSFCAKEGCPCTSVCFDNCHVNSIWAQATSTQTTITLDDCVNYCEAEPNCVGFAFGESGNWAGMCMIYGSDLTTPDSTYDWGSNPSSSTTIDSTGTVFTNVASTGVDCYVQVSDPSQSPTVNPSTSPSVMPSTAPTTSIPSVTPSVAPSGKPSVAPSLEPTIDPSVAPSSTPSTPPTNFPSVNPSLSPSLTPSVCPSVSPSTNPSTSPSTKPSVAPSVDPSVSPSVVPTVAPSNNPTTPIPSCAPSVAPTVLPSVSPSVAPSNEPTTSIPSCSPSVAPTVLPSVSPSFAPSNEPTTSIPSCSPSVAPTVLPSVSPSVAPSNEPTTSIPSCSPSVAPTVLPSASPSVAPSNEPTISFPSCSPSVGPSVDPSTAPSFVPSQSPTTSRPSVAPSSCPSMAPVVAPSFQPSETPTTSEPTVAPTSFPSTVPTVAPSAVPSTTPTTSDPTVAPSSAPSQTPSTSIPSSSPTRTDCIDIWTTSATLPVTTTYTGNSTDIFTNAEVSELVNMWNEGEEFSMLLTVSSTCQTGDVQIAFSGFDGNGGFTLDVPAGVTNTDLRAVDVIPAGTGTNKFEILSGDSSCAGSTITIHSVLFLYGDCTAAAVVTTTNSAVVVGANGFEPSAYPTYQEAYGTIILHLVVQNVTSEEFAEQNSTILDNFATAVGADRQNVYWGTITTSPVRRRLVDFFTIESDATVRSLSWLEHNTYLEIIEDLEWQVKFEEETQALFPRGADNMVVYINGITNEDSAGEAETRDGDAEESDSKTSFLDVLKECFEMPWILVTIGVILAFVICAIVFCFACGYCATKNKEEEKEDIVLEETNILSTYRVDDGEETVDDVSKLDQQNNLNHYGGVRVRKRDYNYIHE